MKPEEHENWDKPREHHDRRGTSWGLEGPGL